MINKEYFYNFLKDMGVEIKSLELEQFDKFSDLLLEWNEKINLTTIVDEKGIIIKHFVDSLTCLKYINKKDSILDVGTGAGFPGIPLKIMLEDNDVTLLDSLNKRITYLNDVINVLNLSNIKAVHGRAEEFGRNKDYRESFDVVTARAVANLRVLSEYCLPFVKKGGIFLAMKGSNIEEIEESRTVIEKMGGKIECIDRISLNSDEEIIHHIIKIKKINNIPKEYPRRIVK